MDFGIKATLLVALRVYDGASRGSGRTTALLDQAQDGDTIVVLSGVEARHVNRLAKEKGRKLIVEGWDSIKRNGPPRGHGGIHMDHTVVAAIYRSAMDNADREIAHFTRRAVCADEWSEREEIRPIMTMSEYFRRRP